MDTMKTIRPSFSWRTVMINQSRLYSAVGVRYGMFREMSDVLSHWSSFQFLFPVYRRTIYQGCNHGWKVEGDQGLGPNTGALEPRARSAKSRAGCWAWEGVDPSRCEGPGYHSRKIFENSDAESCILVTTCCEISCFLKTMAKRLGGNQYTVGPPT